jgi:hypothetical protein
MKDDRRLERLYEGLTPKETATLVYSHLSRGNVAEADRIRDLVPMKVYRLPDPEHVDHFERLRRATLHYGMQRWRYQAHCFAASGIMLDCYHSCEEEDEERGQECFDAWQIWETRLLSLDAALEAVCTKHGVDIADVRRMAGVDGPYEVLGLGEVDPELVAEMTQTFDNLLDGNR